MSVGDRIKTGDGSTWTSEVTVAVYEPLWENDGKLRLDAFGAATIIKLGGVKGGTTGVIAGPTIRVHRLQLTGEPQTASLGGTDLVHLIPVNFDQYQRTAWIPGHHCRVVSGGHGLDFKPNQ